MNIIKEEILIERMPSTKDINDWKQGNIITIEAGTGAGKSHFIKNSLYEYAKENNKKILMLLHRVNCLNQFAQEIISDNKEDVIHLATFQSIEHRVKRKYEIDFSEYDYIVCDEFHYFFSDAAFNITTDISLNTILAQKDKILIMMSATGQYVRRYINNQAKLSTINYALPITFENIKSLSFYKKDETLDAFINERIRNNEKAIVFIQSATKAYKLHKRYQNHSMFNCSESDKHYKYVNKDKIKTMLDNERFEDSILITTTALDAGVNIIDKQVTHILVDVEDVDVLIQCIGRKRCRYIDKETGEWVSEKVNVYIKNITNNQLGGKRVQLDKRIERADFLRKHTVKEYVEKFGRDYDINNIVYDDIVDDEHKSTKKVNELMYFKTMLDKVDIYFMLDCHKSYIKYIASRLNQSDYIVVEDKIENKTIEEYLHSILGKKLYKEEQNELKEVFKKNGLNARTTGINTINGNMKDRDMPYVLEIGKRKSYQDENKKIKKEKSHWILAKKIYK